MMPWVYLLILAGAGLVWWWVCASVTRTAGRWARAYKRLPGPPAGPDPAGADRRRPPC